jgi:8-oxo-dGTP pyrophosphatase MutT (NUDIX family)
MKFHPGQIAFPGGKVDQNDSSALAAALREANEEVGINPTSVEIIGKLSGLYVSVSNFHIAPFVGWYKTKPNFIQNIHEVDRIINFPLLKFINLTKNTNTDINTYTGKLNVPCFFFKEEIIWGATAMILTELFDVIKQLPAIQELH